MKKIGFTILSTLLITISSYCQTEKKGQTTTIKGKGNDLDTVVTEDIDLFAGQRGINRYKIEDTAVRILKPYFLTEIVDPLNLTHPIYLAHMKDGRDKLAEAKATLLRDINTSKSTRDYMSKYYINNEMDINSIKYVHLPSYYLATNIVNFQDGDKMGKYYNLGTGVFNYLVFRQNKLIGFLQFYNNKSIYRSIPDHLVEGYYMVKRLGKNPIMLNQSISITDPKKISLAFDSFGYADQGYLFYSECIAGVVQYSGHSQKKPVYRKEYRIKTADSHVSKPLGLSSIEQWVESAVRSIQRYKQ